MPHRGVPENQNGSNSSRRIDRKSRLNFRLLEIGYERSLGTDIIE